MLGRLHWPQLSIGRDEAIREELSKPELPEAQRTQLTAERRKVRQRRRYGHLWASRAVWLLPCCALPTRAGLGQRLAVQLLLLLGLYEPPSAAPGPG